MQTHKHIDQWFEFDSAEVLVRKTISVKRNLHKEWTWSECISLNLVKKKL